MKQPTSMRLSRLLKGMWLMTKLPLDKKLGKRRWDELTREFLKHPNVTTVFFTELDVADDVIDHQQDFVEEVVEPAVNVVTEASELNGMVPSSKRPVAAALDDDANDELEILGSEDVEWDDDGADEHRGC
ncbi:MAG: hypothetical protein LQ340_002023 [Diploschistes diacapsis]|nr:MAG: hypothetical protein LQ340_002023 [Diploschistes diacapsis]